MFVCCPEKEAKKRNNKMNDLKQLMEAVEEQLLVPCNVVCCPPCVPQVQNVPEPTPPPPPPPPPTCSPPDIMVCYKCEKVEKSNEKKKNGRPPKKSNQQRGKRAKSRELRASILYCGCDCEKRNGLQDDCRRTGCHGSPECLTTPEVTCGPSEFSNGKHLGRKFNEKKKGIVGNEKKQGTQGNGENGDEEGNGKTTVYYNCYPATIKC